MIAQALGGIGMFLVGMVLVTDGLRAAAGDALRRFLLRLTGGRLKAIASGAVVTALVQSSSATTVATIGFVSAGLLTFDHALGIIFGANIGTTATGWIVALLGLKFGVSVVALPLVGVGALVKLFARGRAAHFGLALAGFGVIFVGIDVLQSGMQGLSRVLTPAELPGDTFAGRLFLVGVGALMTAVMQSSSAAVTTALAALHSGTLSLNQAAAMVIGINIGTTVTAGIAAIGASTAAKRTAFAHLLFNMLTGVVAFAALPPFVWGIGRLGAQVGAADATLLIAAFHTAFNLLGVALLLPFAGRFAAMVTRLIRSRGPELTRRLDPQVAAQGTVASEAVRSTVVDIAVVVLGVLHALVERHRLEGRESQTLEAAAAALRDTEEYVGVIKGGAPLSEAGQQRHVSTIHAIDHLGRLVDEAFSAVPMVAVSNAELDALEAQTASVLAQSLAWARGSGRPAPVDAARHLAEDVSTSRRELRADLLARTATGAVAPSAAGAVLERLRWLEHLTHHLHRLTEHLADDRAPSLPAAEAAWP